MNKADRLARLMLLAGWLVLWSRGTATASAGTVLRADPPALGLKPGEQGTIALVVENAQDLYGAEFHLTFDPAVVEVVDADAAQAGIQIQSGDWLQNTFVAVNQTDNATGAIDYAVTLLNPAPPLSGTGTLALFTFKAKANGNSVLKIEKALLATRDALEIQAEWRNGAVGVSTSGRAPEVTTSGEIQSPAASNNDTVLAIAAGVGVFAFVVALGAVAFIWWRRQTTDENEAN